MTEADLFHTLLRDYPHVIFLTLALEGAAIWILGVREGVKKERRRVQEALGIPESVGTDDSGLHDLATARWMRDKLSAAIIEADAEQAAEKEETP
jgi:hypothetical protein